MKKWIKYILVPLGFFVFVGALALLHNQLKGLSYTDIINALKAIPALKIVIAMCLALSYYIVLGGYDIVAFKYIRSNPELRPKDILFTCFVSNVLGSNTGYSMLFGGSIRYRLYSLHNVSMMNVTKVLLFSSATIWLGLLSVGGIVFTFAPVSLEGITEHSTNTRGIGIFFLILLSIYILLSLIHSKPIKVLKWKISFPDIKIVLSQIILASLDWIIASLTLYTLMPTGEMPYFVLLKVFLVSQLLGIISQVPGGMGVFEASISVLLPTAAENPGVIGGLLAYRAIFYFFPLAIALIMLAVYEIMRVTKTFEEKRRIFGKTISSVIVQALAALTFFAGMIAIFTTSTPINVAQLQKIISLLPAWFVDISHFLLSITAIGLLFISRGIQLRIYNAYKWGCRLLFFAIILILIVGEPLPVLLSFIVLFVALLLARKYFYRDIPILNTALSTWWFTAIGGVFVLSVWIGFFVNRQDIFSWIHLDVFFENLLSTSDAARFLRAFFGMLVIFLIVAIEQIFRNFLKKPVVFDREDIKRIVDSSDHTYSFNALSSDKRFVINENKDAFIMYATSRNSWIALGDPVGKFSSKNELLWKAKEISYKESLKLAFIGIDKRYLHIYDDIGLDIFKVGQEAKIPLRTFEKDIDQKQYFKQLIENIESQGFKYEIIRSEDFEKYRETFSQINKEWEKNYNYIERNFIPGQYDETYMKDMDFSILKKDGKVFAFSVFFATKSRYEISSSIIRHYNYSEDTFTYMLLKNILWAKENGFKWFDLGLAYFPSGDNENDVIKRFAKMFMFAEHFEYDLSRLREFKNKFAPIWHNKYVAVHPDKYILAFLKNFTALISPPIKRSGRQFFKRFFR